MHLEDQFEVPAPPERVWALLNDVPSVVPCMPGAELEEVVGPDRWKATMAVRLGPVALNFKLDVKREEMDDAARAVKLAIAARELRGRGQARATVSSTVEGNGEGARVSMVTDLNMQGAVAQYGRGIVGEVASDMTKRFAECLAGRLARPAEPEPAEAAAPVPATPVPGLRLGLRSVWRALVARLRRRRRA